MTRVLTVLIAVPLIAGCSYTFPKFWGNDDAAVDSLPDPALTPVPILEPAPAPGPTPGEWQSNPLVMDLPAGKWVCVYTVDGLERDPGRADNGGLEHVFGDLQGRGFDRVWIMNMGEGRRMRGFIDDAGREYKTWKRRNDLNQPGDGVARVEWAWDGERICVSINGREWFKEPLTGQPERLIVGGTQSRGRSFGGRWRDVRVIQ